MKRNIGNIERVVRVIIGLSIVSLTVVGPQSPWALVGLIPIFTGLTGWCPPYDLLGISSAGNECRNPGL